MSKNLNVIHRLVFVDTMSGISEFTHEFFEASSKAWKANKARYGQAMYRYKKNAFPKEDAPGKPTQSKRSIQQTETILKQRQAIDEPAPFRERRSPRLRLLHLQKTYSSGYSDNGDCGHSHLA
jgi:hypothetical protein